LIGVHTEMLREQTAAERKRIADAVAEAGELSAAPLASLRELESEADKRKVSREHVLTEQWVRAARPVAQYTPKKFPSDPSDVLRPLYSDRMANTLANRDEQLHAVFAELTNAVHELRLDNKLQKLTSGALARLAIEAAEQGDAATINAIWNEHEFRSEEQRYASGDARTKVAVALRDSMQTITLPGELTNELELLDQLADLNSALRDTAREIETGVAPPSVLSRAVSEVGGDAALAGWRASRAEQHDAAQQRAIKIVQGAPDAAPEQQTATPTIEPNTPQ
jgi:hypothetical protein